MRSTAKYSGLRFKPNKSSTSIPSREQATACFGNHSLFIWFILTEINEKLKKFKNINFNQTANKGFAGRPVTTSCCPASHDIPEVLQQRNVEQEQAGSTGRPWVPPNPRRHDFWALGSASPPQQILDCCSWVQHRWLNFR